MTDTRKKSVVAAGAQRFAKLIKTAAAKLRSASSDASSAPDNAPKDNTAQIAKAFCKRHRALLERLGLEYGPAGFSFSEIRQVQDRGIETNLRASATVPYLAREISNVELRQTEAAEKWLLLLRRDLQFKVNASLSHAAAALKGLADRALRPDEMKWLGGEEEVRRTYLEFPASLSADEAHSTAKTRLKEVLAKTSKPRYQLLTTRMKKLTPAVVKGKSLHRSYIERLNFLSSTLEVELNIQAFLDPQAVDRLSAESDEKFPDAVDALLARSKRQLTSRLEEQFRDLERRIETLPHIDLLSDDEIAATVAPYYGGLNRALKKRRAKSALVAVEERAREAKYQDDVIKLNEQRDAYADVAGYYPLARSLKRQLVLYVGPTNSGKTWRSLNELAEAESGAYLSPLRLLALEGQEELEKRGRPTSFLTGEERDLNPDAKFMSSTIEMLNLEAQVDAVVIDEVQLLADERRGWAWLEAVVGAPAKKVIMTGSPDCVDLVKNLATYLGEELTIHECQRYNELRVADAPIRLRDVSAGTAIVCFSRRDVLRIKTTIQENSELKVAVVYGNLSPQVRREEARRFRSGEADILVATDAIAMGLNLPIKEVLFYTTRKFNGEEMCELTPSEIRQIGGRAGRYGFAQYGVVNALDEDSLELIRDAIGGSFEMLQPPFYVAPGHNHVRLISEVLGTNSLERILTFFERAIEFSDDRFARSNIDDLSYLSTFVDERVPFLDVGERLTIASAPVGIRNETIVHWFLNRMLPAFKVKDTESAFEERDDLDDLLAASSHFESEEARNQLELRDAEDYLKTLTVYAWLAYRYPDVFTRLKECEARREAVNAFVERSLRSAGGRRCVVCDVELPAAFSYRICEACFAKGRTTRRPAARKGQKRGGRRGRL